MNAAQYLGHSIDEVSTRVRLDHQATLLSVNRGGRAFVNPQADFRLDFGDDAIVVADSLGKLAPLKIRDAMAPSHAASAVPSA